MRLKRRLIYGGLTIVTMISGLLSRQLASFLPELVNNYLGDSLWALMVFFGCCCLFPRLSLMKGTILALSFCYLIEVSQLYHAEWIDQIRATTLGGLVLGYGFLWRDIVAYTMGIGLGVLIRVGLSKAEKKLGRKSL